MKRRLMEFVHVKYANNKLISADIKDHHEIINEYVEKKGMEYVGFIPVVFGPNGKIQEIELLFRKPIVRVVEKVIEKTVEKAPATKHAVEGRASLANLSSVKLPEDRRAEREKPTVPHVEGYKKEVIERKVEDIEAHVAEMIEAKEHAEVQGDEKDPIKAKQKSLAEAQSLENFENLEKLFAK